MDWSFWDPSWVQLLVTCKHHRFRESIEVVCMILVSTCPDAKGPHRSSKRGHCRGSFQEPYLLHSTRCFLGEIALQSMGVVHAQEPGLYAALMTP